MWRNALVGLLLLTGCGGTIVVSGIEVYERHWLQAADAVATRASFDMSCPREQLRLFLLHKQGRHPDQIGVQGCGQRVTYVRPDLNKQLWIANVEASQR